METEIKERRKETKIIREERSGREKKERKEEKEKQDNRCKESRGRMRDLGERRGGSKIREKGEKVSAGAVL